MTHEEESLVDALSYLKTKYPQHDLLIRSKSSEAVSIFLTLDGNWEFRQVLSFVEISNARLCLIDYTVWKMIRKLEKEHAANTATDTA